MELQETFKAVHPSIVAIGSRIVFGKPGEPPAFPQVFGTGFIVDSRGIVATNRHVAELIQKILCDPETGASGACAILCTDSQDEEGSTVKVHFIDIKYVSVLSRFVPSQGYWGMPLPDIAFIQINAMEVPALTLIRSPNSLQMGMDVATAGFAMGEIPLTHYGYVSQVTPFLRKGIVSSVFPYPCAFPDGFTMDVMTQGGESGSPIFLTNSPEVIGILHSGFDGTNITEALPSNIIARALEICLETQPFDFNNVPTLKDLVNKQMEPEMKWKAVTVLIPVPEHPPGSPE